MTCRHSQDWSHEAILADEKLQPHSPVEQMQTQF